MRTRLAHSAKLLVAALALLAGCGCGTVTTRTKGLGGPYSGVAHDLEKLASADEWCDLSVQGQASNIPFWLPCGLLWVCDLPLSFTADTLLLPVDALRTRAPEPEEDQCCSKAQTRR